MHSLSVTACLLLATSGSAAESLYPKSSKVLQVNARNFDDKIKNTYNSSIVEFYAPWCGHCKNLQPAFEKAAQNLEGIAQVAAVNCDDDENKELCGKMGIQGFPTLKTVRQTGNFGKPIISDYNGGRTASDIAEAVKSLLPNHVTRLQDKEWDSWLEKKNDTAKAILFSDKGTTSALIKSLANDFYESIEIAQVRNNQKIIIEAFDVSTYPTLIVLPGGDQEAVVYDGSLKRPGMLAFLGKYGKVRTPPAKGTKKSKTTSSKANKKASSSFSKASASHASSEANESAATASTATVDEPVTESPNPIVDTEATPVAVPVTDPVPVLESQDELQTKCFGPKTNTCVLALISSSEDTDSSTARASLASLSEKHTKLGDRLFPFFIIPSTNPATAPLKKGLDLESTDKLQLIAVNSKRSWWRQYDTSKGLDILAVEKWIDGIRLGEGSKNKLPADILPAAVAATAAAAGGCPHKGSAASASEAKAEPSLAHGEL